MFGFQGLSSAASFAFNQLIFKIILGISAGDDSCTSIAKI